MRIFWTDGSADPNPGEGGYAVIEEIDGRGVPVALGRENPSTNIRMEGTALLEAMRLAHGEEIEIHTDSQFWVNVLTKWAPAWEQRAWTKKGGPIQNLDLVKKLYGLYTRKNIRLNWVRGHVGTKFNEMADHWANKARSGMTLEDLSE